MTILQDGTYFDATIYQARPVPMALEPGTVYEVQHSGEPQGLFIVSAAGRQKDDWYANGQWKPGPEQPAVMAKPGKPSNPALNLDDDGRPILRRPGSSNNQPSQSPAQTAPASKAPEIAAKPKTSSPSNDDEVFDPDRPRLRRRKEISPQESTPSTQVEQKPESSSSKRVEGEALPPAASLLPAVSDATPYETRPYKFQWRPEEQARLTKEMVDLGQRALRQYLQGRSVSARGPLEGIEVRAFDLYYNNDMELVLTARQQLASNMVVSNAAVKKALSAYVTVVGMMDSSGQLRKLFSSATDDNHLDVEGRLELIDAVDADGDGRGELLFRRIGFNTQSFELYRVGRDQLWKLFAGAESSR